MDPPRYGHNIIDLSTKDTGEGTKNLFPNSSNTFCTSDERTTSLQKTKRNIQIYIVPEVSFIRRFYCIPNILWSREVVQGPFNWFIHNTLGELICNQDCV